jgi:hypothetical protein
MKMSIGKILGWILDFLLDVLGASGRFKRRMWWAAYRSGSRRR